MSKINKIKGVIFDMDGVLCDSEEFIAEASVEMFRKRYNTQVDKKHFKQFIGAGETKFIQGVAEIYGIESAMPDDKIFTYEIYLQMIAGKMLPLAGVQSFVNFSKNSGLKIAIASAADLMKVEGNLREIGFSAEFFDAVVTGCDVKNNKPDPEIFLKAAEFIGVEPASCVVIEDAVNGVIAAKTAGAHCLGITSSFTADELLQAGADWTAQDLSQVPTELTNLFHLQN